MKVINSLKISNRIAKFFIPFIIAGIGIILIYSLLDNQISIKLLLLMFAYFFPPLGKESIIPIGVSGGEITIPIYIITGNRMRWFSLVSDRSGNINVCGMLVNRVQVCMSFILKQMIVFRCKNVCC